MIDAYIDELARSLHVRGRARRRFLAECRDHLIDLAGERGQRQALAAFGPPATVAAEFDLAIAACRGRVGAWCSAAGVLAVGCSTLALIHAADPAARAPLFWVVAFAVAAQVAVVCVALTVTQGLCLRHQASTAGELALLCRRMTIALAAATAAMFSAGAALPGQGSAVLLLAGPVLACVAALVIARVWTLTRRLDGAREHVDRSPFRDLRQLTGIALPDIGPVPIAALAMLAAYVRDLGEAGGSPTRSLMVAAIEGTLVLLAYAALHRPLGLRTRPATR